MPDLDLLVPSALVDPGLASDLLRDRAMPHLARVLARAGTNDTLRGSGHAPLAPWQAWVFAHRAGVDASGVNVAELWAMACGLAPAADGGRFLAEPAHFTVAKDHLRLDDPASLAVTLPEARELAAAIAPVLADAGWRLDPLEPATVAHWPVARADGAALSAPSIERAIGDNVAAWQPRSTGDAALAWRRCVNEIQMTWFDHPVNEAREARGLPAINTLWLSGNGAPRGPIPRFVAVDTGLPLLAALPVDPQAGRALATFDGFIAPARADDWSGWRDALAAFDAWIGEGLARQKAGAVGTLTLALCGRDVAKTTTLARGDRARFWRGWGRGPALGDTFADIP